jgi:hypothetical protein
MLNVKSRLIRLSVVSMNAVLLSVVAPLEQRRNINTANN